MLMADDGLNIIGTCIMHRQMKTTLLEDILQSLRPKRWPNNSVRQEIVEKAKFSLEEILKFNYSFFS